MRFFYKKLLVLVAFCMAGQMAFAQASPIAEFDLPSVLSSGCVLQRNARVPFWGKGHPGQSVTIQVSWSKKLYSGLVRPDGNWWIPIPTPDAGGPYQVGLHCMKTDVVLEDVLIGEVWVCSGQSNMEMPVAPIDSSYSGVQDFEAELANANHPQLRLFTVANKASAEPQSDCEGTWAACSAATLKDFSSTAYFFGRELHRELGVPVGVISADYGGSHAEAWMSAKALRGQVGYERIVELLDGAANSESPWAGAQEEAAHQWSLEVEKRDALLERSWAGREEATAGDKWRGLLWVRFEVELDSTLAYSFSAQRWGEGSLWFAVYVNGTLIERNAFGNPIIGESAPVQFPAGVLRAGKNEIMVAMLSGSDAATIGKVHSEHAVEGLSENGGLTKPEPSNWRFAQGLDMRDFPWLPNYLEDDQSKPTGLFNAMIAPIIPYRIRGVVWYQGESNHDQPEQYRSLFPALIRDWRGWWRQGVFPFYFVQIAPFAYDPDRGRPAQLRAAQRAALELPNTGMVVTLDIGDSKDIHPKNKQEVGRRLALWALARDYGRDELVCSGPLDVGVEVEGNVLRVRFEQVGGGLIAADGGLRHFELAGADMLWHDAVAEIDGDGVILRSDAVDVPIHVRYCGGAADVGTLFNREGLAASSFQR